MLPPKCFTCGKLLADIEIEWKEMKKTYESNDKLTDDQIADLLSKLLDKLKITDGCCRSQVITYVDLIKIII